jgi:hypothetical protein
MKKILFLLLIIPAVVNAQFKRSATELAKETIRDYLTGRLFKNSSYQSIHYGQINACKEKDPEVVWSIEHEFEISSNQPGANKKDSVQKIYRFIFYFDKKMKVLRAESFLE